MEIVLMKWSKDSASADRGSAKTNSLSSNKTNQFTSINSIKKVWLIDLWIGFVWLKERVCVAERWSCCWPPAAAHSIKNFIFNFIRYFYKSGKPQSLLSSSFFNFLFINPQTKEWVGLCWLIEEKFSFLSICGLWAAAPAAAHSLIPQTSLFHSACLPNCSFMKREEIKEWIVFFYWSMKEESKRKWSWVWIGASNT